MQIPDTRRYQQTCIDLITAKEIVRADGSTLLNGVQISYKKSIGLERIYLRVFEKGRALLEIPGGAGKSRIVLESAKILDVDKKVLIVCKPNSINTWIREVRKWWPEMINHVVVIHKQKGLRKHLWKEIEKPQYKIIITTYDTAKSDELLIPMWMFSLGIADECQKIRNHKLKLTESITRLLKQPRHVIMMSAKIVRELPSELYSYIRILKPDLYKSYWKWVNSFCIVNHNGFGTEIVGPKNTDLLAGILANCFIRIKEKDIEDQRPPISRDLMEYEMSNEQAKLYSQMSANLVAVTESGEILVAPNAAVKQLRLRQLLTCPKILDPKLGYGGALENVVEKFEDDPHTVIFTPFVAAIPFISELIRAKGYPEPFTLKGGDGAKEVGYVEETFNGPKGIDKACIVSTRFAESFELWSAKRAFHIGFEWMQDVNRQADLRLHRLITPHPVNIYYCAALETVDYEILNKLDEREWNANLTFKDFENIAHTYLATKQGE